MLREVENEGSPELTKKKRAKASEKAVAGQPNFREAGKRAQLLGRGVHCHRGM